MSYLQVWTGQEERAGGFRVYAKLLLPVSELFLETLMRAFNMQAYEALLFACLLQVLEVRRARIFQAVAVPMASMGLSSLLKTHCGRLFRLLGRMCFLLHWRCVRGCMLHALWLWQGRI